MYLPVPTSGTGDDARGPSTRDRPASSIRSRRAATSDKQASKAPTSRPSSNLHGSRRSHRKVRTGCTKCKERKIKVCTVLPSPVSPGTVSIPSDLLSLLLLLLFLGIYSTIYDPSTRCLSRLGRPPTFCRLTQHQSAMKPSHHVGNVQGTMYLATFRIPGRARSRAQVHLRASPVSMPA